MGTKTVCITQEVTTANYKAFKFAFKGTSDKASQFASSVDNF